MSLRSDVWYAVPENRERRKENMRSYFNAMIVLAARYPQERSKQYLLAKQAGRPAGREAMKVAYAAVRDAHKDEFCALLAGMRGTCSGKDG